MASPWTPCFMRASVPSDLNQPLAVVAHDAGATNLILGWIRERPAAPLRLCAGGPASRLFSAALPDHALLPASEVLTGATLLLSGTSGTHTDLEHEVRRLARSRGVRSIGVIDHWVNYAARFTRGGETVLPDELWVADAHAAALARRTFPGCPVFEQPNRYLENLAATARAASRPHPGRTHVLYVLEPLHSDWGQGGVAGEFQALDYFLDHTALLGLPADSLIRLRPHPSEPREKYAGWLDTKSNPRLSLDAAGTLADAIGWADWVVGGESYALVAGLAAGRRVVSTLPPWAPACRLPHPEIRHLREISAEPALPAPTLVAG
jgi:hypothetical protein